MDYCSEKKCFEQQFFDADGDFCSTSSTSESLKHLVACSCDSNESTKMAMQNKQQTLESIWRRAVGMCEPSSLKNFLQKRGKLVSVDLKQGTTLCCKNFMVSCKLACKVVSC